MELLVETLQSEQAREHAIAGAMASLHLGDTLRTYLTEALHDQAAESLATFLTAGVRNDEVRGGFGLVTSLLGHDDFPMALRYIHLSMTDVADEFQRAAKEIQKRYTDDK